MTSACAAGRVDAQADSDSTPGSSSSMLDGPVDVTPDASTPTVSAEASAPAADADASAALGLPEAMPAPETGVELPEGNAPEATVSESSTPDTSTTVSCLPVPNTDTLPFAVDTAVRFIPSGYEGDRSAVTMPTDPTCNGNRSGSSALGSCHPVTYKPLAPGVGVAGWAGVLWQHPVNNWGTAPGYGIPPGATKVSFWARGARGGEVVTFLVGFRVNPSPSAPCTDAFSGSLNQTLTTAWTQYTISLGGQTYGPGVISPFGFVLAAAGQPVGDAGAGDGGAGALAVSFFVDDIEWQ